MFCLLFSGCKILLSQFNLHADLIGYNSHTETGLMDEKKKTIWIFIFLPDSRYIQANARKFDEDVDHVVPNAGNRKNI